MAHFVGKNSFVNIYPLLRVWLKNSCLNKSKFSSGFSPIKYGKKNKLSEYIIARFWDSLFYVYKEKFSMNFPKNASKQQKDIL